MIGLMIYVSGVLFVMALMLALVIKSKEELKVVDAFKMVVLSCLSWFTLVLIGLYAISLWWLRKRNMKR